jgi:hypothetical protein
MTSDEERQKADERIRYWGRAYLDSTLDSHRRAKQFFSERDSFTAYLYLFVVFNNLYCLLARFEGEEKQKIRAAIGRLPDEAIERIYTPHYARLLEDLNSGQPEQFVFGPDAARPLEGIVNMGKYFLGKEPGACTSHIEKVTPAGASTQEKKSTLGDLAAELLYTIRNNQFHAVKGAQRLTDTRTLELAYRLLAPIAQAMLPMATREVGQISSVEGTL